MAPSLFTLQHFTDRSEADRVAVRESMHRAYIVGGGLSLAVGAGASLVSDSWYPLVACAIVLVVLVVQYEWALGNPHATSEAM